MSNRLHLLILCFVIVACKRNSSSELTGEHNTLGNVKINSAIKDSVIKKMKELTDDTARFFSAIHSKEFEDNSLIREHTPADDSWEGYNPGASLFGYTHDSLDLFLIYSLGIFHVQKFGEYWSVIHFSNPREEPKRFYKTEVNERAYKDELEVPCRFSVVLDREDFEKGKFIYGSVEAESNDYFIKSRLGYGYMTGKIKFKAYFKAMRIN